MKNFEVKIKKDCEYYCCSGIDKEYEECTLYIPRIDTLIAELFIAAAGRVGEEDCDPCMVVVAALCQGEKIPEEELRLIWKIHREGLWELVGDEELKIFSRWCDRCGTPMKISKETERINDQTVYRGDLGDCCMAEAAKGNHWAVWTRKNRLYVGFEEEKTAERFRA